MLRSLSIAVLVIAIATAQTTTKTRAKSKKARVTTTTTTNAPAPDLDANSWPLETLAVEGNRVYTQAQVLAVAGLKAGQKASKQDFEDAREKLLATGAFESVGYRYAPAADARGYTAAFEVSETPQQFPLLFEDLPVKDAEIREWLKGKDPMFGPKIPATQPALSRYKQFVAQYLANHGYNEPIIASLSPDVAPELVVVFRPAAVRPSVAHVKFANTGDISAGDLRTAMYPVAVGTLYSEPLYRQLLETTIRPLYEARGHLKVVFPKIETEPATDVKGVVVSTQVEQGPVYQLAAVAFSGTSIDKRDLDKATNLRTKATVNFDEVKAAQGRIEEMFKHRGYLQVSSKIARTIHEDTKTVAVSFQIEPGPQFVFGKLEIVGLDVTSEPHIRKLWALGEGKPFNPQYPDHFLEVVKEEGLFDNLAGTSSETKINRDTHTVDVTLNFKGGQPAPNRERRRPGERPPAERP